MHENSGCTEPGSISPEVQCIFFFCIKIDQDKGMALIFLNQVSEATRKCWFLMVFATEQCKLRWSYAACSSQILGGLSDVLGVLLSTLSRGGP